MRTTLKILLALGAAVMLMGGCRDESSQSRYQSGKARRSELARPSQRDLSPSRETVAVTPGESSGGEALDATEVRPGMDATEVGIGGSGRTELTTPGIPNLGQEELVAKLHEANQTEVKAGELARSNGRSREVKSFGEMLIKDHRQADQDLSSLCEKKEIALRDPAEKDTETPRKLEALKGVKGADFDRQFGQLMADGHEKVISLVKTNVSAVKDAELKAQLQGMLPRLEQHRELALKLANPKQVSGRRPSEKY
jgi:putative membrane protein